MIDRGKHNILGIQIDAVDYEAAVERIAAAAHDRQPLSVSALAVHGLMTGALDDEKVAVPLDDGDRSEWIREVTMEVAEGILSQGFEPTPSFAACSVCDYRLVCPAAER